jgi:A/G-specific adenine glycosylase
LTKDAIVSIVKSGDLFLVAQNPEKGLLAGLWDFPHVLTEEDCTAYATRQEMTNDHLPKYVKGFDQGVKKRSEAGQCQHLFTHIKRTIFVELIDLDDNMVVEDGDGYKWVSEGEMLAMAVPTTLRKAFALLTVKTKKRKTEKNQPSILGFLKKIK